MRSFFILFWNGLFCEQFFDNLFSRRFILRQFFDFDYLIKNDYLINK